MLESRSLEAAEAEINRFVEKRASSRNQANELAQEWARSEAAHREKLRQANRWQWIRYFECLAANHAQLSEENRQKAAALLERES